MPAENKMRTVKRITGYSYEEIDFMELKKGDLFTLTDPDGKSVKYNDNVILEAMGDPYLNKNGVGEILMSDYRPMTLH